MSEKEMNSYRFGTGQEPTDEMLEQVMKEVAQDARESSKRAADAHFEHITVLYVFSYLLNEIETGVVK